MPNSGGIKTKNKKSLKGSGWFDGNNQPNMSNQNGYTLNSLNPFASNPNGTNQNGSMFSSLGNMFSSDQGNKNQQYGTLNFGNSNNPNMYGGKGPSAVAATPGYNPFAAKPAWGGGAQNGGWEPSYGTQPSSYGAQARPYVNQTRSYGAQTNPYVNQNQSYGAQQSRPYGSQSTMPYGMPNQMNGMPNQMNGMPNQMNGMPNQMNGMSNQMNGMSNQNVESFWTWGGKRRKGTKKMRGGYTNNTPLTGLASSAAPINDIKSAQPQQMVGGRRTRRRRSCCCKNKHTKSCKNYKK